MGPASVCITSVRLVEPTHGFVNSPELKRKSFFFIRWTSFARWTGSRDECVGGMESLKLYRVFFREMYIFQLVSLDVGKKRKERINLSYK